MRRFTLLCCFSASAIASGCDDTPVVGGPAPSGEAAAALPSAVTALQQKSNARPDPPSLTSRWDGTFVGRSAVDREEAPSTDGGTLLRVKRDGNLVRIQEWTPPEFAEISLTVGENPNLATGTAVAWTVQALKDPTARPADVAKFDVAAFFSGGALHLMRTPPAGQEPLAGHVTSAVARTRELLGSKPLDMLSPGARPLVTSCDHPRALVQDDEALYLECDVETRGEGEFVRVTKGDGKVRSLAPVRGLIDVVSGGGEIYFATTDPPRIARVPAIGGELTDVVAPAHVIDLDLLGGSEVVWLDGRERALFSAPGTGGEKKRIWAAPEGATVREMATDGPTFAVVVRKGPRSELWRITRGGGASKVHETDEELSDAEFLGRDLFVRQGAGRVQRIGAGGGLTTFETDQNDAQGFWLDGTSAFWVEHHMRGAVRRKPLEGSAKTATLAAGWMLLPTQLVLDEKNVYVLDQGNAEVPDLGAVWVLPRP